MSSEIQLNVQLTATNGSFAQTFYPGTVNINQAAMGCHSPVVIVGSTAAEQLTFGDLSTYGVVVGRNLDAANYVTIGPSTAAGGAMRPFMKVKAGEPFAFRLSPGIIWKWQANSANVKVQLQVYED